MMDGPGCLRSMRQCGTAGPFRPACPAFCPPAHCSRCGMPQVHFELTGARGSSGVLHPAGTPKSFGAGRLDLFDYPALPCLGELQSARVGTDASGFFPSWHLQLLVVTHLPTGRVWQFRWVVDGRGG